MTLLRHLHLKDRKAPLSPFMCWVCFQIHRLDKIPRYGRLYPLKPPGSKPHWRYMKRGWWGLYLLDDLGLLWAYIDTMAPYDKNGEVDAAPR